MHLMKPKDTEAPAFRAARLCGLAAIGAGLMGSAALLHVTPVFAQAATSAPTPAAPPVPVTAQPLALSQSTARTAASQVQAQTDPAKPPSEGRRSHVTISHNGVIIDSDDGGYHHTFTGADGREFDVTTNDARDLTPEEQRHWEETVAKAEAHAAETLKKVNSPEFKARIAAATARAAEAEARENSPEFKARIAAAQAGAAEAEARVNSPEFKARIAAAQARAADAEKMVNSPEFKARIAAAEARAAEAEKMVNSPENSHPCCRERREKAGSRFRPRAGARGCGGSIRTVAARSFCLSTGRPVRWKRWPSTRPVA